MMSTTREARKCEVNYRESDGGEAIGGEEGEGKEGAYTA
jgi:hypothetical protein